MERVPTGVDPDDGQVIARLPCSPTRRAMGVVFLALPGCILIWLALTRTAETALVTLASLAVGAAMVWGAWRVWRATEGGLVLTHAGLHDDSGTLLCPLSQIERVESGILAFKPSGGFLLHLAEPAPWGWVPGLWWRRGRRLGIGGSVNARQAKAMSEAIAMLVMRRKDTNMEGRL
ncbi:MAG: hypothetical protein AAFR46_11200 [Pseudomonadota bacterium]